MNDFALPATRYARSGDVSIAYQVMGDAPIDIIMVPGIVSHVEFLHELPGYTAFLRRLASFARVVTFDKRGQGLSDRMSAASSLEERMDDVRAIMDDIGSRQSVLLGFSEGAAMSALFAATYPERVSHLILFGGYTRSFRTEEMILERAKLWAREPPQSRRLMPSQATSADVVALLARFERLSASPGAIKAYSLDEHLDRSPFDPSERARSDIGASPAHGCSHPHRTWPRYCGADFRR